MSKGKWSFRQRAKNKTAQLLKPFSDSHPYVLVNTKRAFVEFFKLLMQQQFVACDTETTGFRHKDDQIIGLSFSWAEDSGFYVPIRHISGEKNLDPEFVLDWLGKFFEDEDITTLWWNSKFDIKFLLSAGVDVRGRVEDGMIASHLLNENEPKKLKWQAEKYIGKGCNRWEKEVDTFRLEYARSQDIPDPTRKRGVRKMRKDEVTYDFVPFRIMVPYASSDTDFALRRYRQIKESDEWTGALQDLYEHELQMTRALVHVEDHGVLIDTEYFEEQSDLSQEEIDRVVDEFGDEAGVSFDVACDYLATDLTKMGRKLSITDQEEIEAAICYEAAKRMMNSPKQLAEMFRNNGIEVPQKKRKNGTVTDCLDKDALQGLIKKGHKLPEHVLACRTLTKIRGTYYESLPKLIQSDGRVHGNNNITGPVTGRSSMSDPNLQNQPRGPAVRGGFVVPSEDWVWVKIDYSQIELRWAAHYSGDPVLTQAYIDEDDVHAIMGRELAEMGGFVWEELDGEERKEFRRSAKAVNFGFLFGMRDESFIDYARQSYGVVVTPKEAADFYEAFHTKFAVYSAFMDDVEREGLAKGHVVNHFGRRRRTPELLKRGLQKWEKNRAVRQLINFLIQGSAADMFKQAFYRVWKFLRDEGARTQAVLQVHDEIDFYWHREELELLRPVLDLMEDFDLDVPVVAEVEWGLRDWGHLSELKPG